MCCFSKHSLHITNKAVDVTLPRRFVNYVFVVVVAQATTQLLIVHLWLVLTLAPPLCHLEDTREMVSNWNKPVRPLQNNRKNVKMPDVKITKTLLLKSLYVFVCFSWTMNLTSAGSDILNSQPSPVQLMKVWQAESNRSSRRNCQSWMGPDPMGKNNTELYISTRTNDSHSLLW